jgi:hypothetical protein
MVKIIPYLIHCYGNAFLCLHCKLLDSTEPVLKAIDLIARALTVGRLRHRAECPATEGDSAREFLGPVVRFGRDSQFQQPVPADSV